MNDLNDEKIQQLLEKGLPPSGEDMSLAASEDFKAYKLLFDALEREPSAGLSLRFAATVTGKIKAKENRRQDIKLHLLVIVLLITGIACAYFSLIMLNKEYAAQLITTLDNSKWILLFTLSVICIVQFLDKKLIKNHQAAF
jgi:hypothetical protein